MNKKMIFFASAAVICSLLFPAAAAKKPQKVMPTVKEGKYNETDLLTASKLPYLPIPGTKEDYAIFQSIGKVSTIVIGRFSQGEKEIVYLSDRNGDGKVDEGSSYFPDIKKFKAIGNPGGEYPAERFRKMKMDIINGISGELS
ncbi:MAG: hypothetical protein ACRCUT_03870 [Spirochaetota bacterium]